MNELKSNFLVFNFKNQTCGKDTKHTKLVLLLLGNLCTIAVHANTQRVVTIEHQPRVLL